MIKESLNRDLKTKKKNEIISYSRILIPLNSDVIIIIKNKVLRTMFLYRLNSEH